MQKSRILEIAARAHVEGHSASHIAKSLGKSSTYILRLLRTAQGGAAIRAARDAIARELAASGSEVIAALSAVALADPADLVDDTGSPRRVDDLPRRARLALADVALDADGRVKAARYADRVAAARVLAQIYGIGAVGGGTQSLADRLAAARARVRAALPAPAPSPARSSSAAADQSADLGSASSD
jgi:hypothetical protein